MKRRNFIELSLGTTLATLGLSQLEIQQKGLKFAQSIAQNTQRKLALLVGINNYPEARLYGCITDVYLQRELLIYRYGFNPQDILMVTDDSEIKPTRNNILQAFEAHLIKQAKPEDVVVFHYSGHGSRVIDVNNSAEKNSTFVPIDRQVNSKEKGQRTVSDIMGKTLFLLMSALPTENVTVVLDSCHSGGGKRGNLTIRSLTGSGDYPSEEELAYQQQWLTRLNLSPQKFEEERKKGVAKGVVIASAGAKQYAADASFDGFNAGAFTYVMTQFLWQEASNQNLGKVMMSLTNNTTAVSSSRQVPEYEAKNNGADQPTYFLNKQVPPAEAVVTKMEGDRVELWLGGIEPQSLAAFNQGAIFSVVNQQGKSQGLVQLDNRQGVKGSGKILKTESALNSGSLLQEQARIIPSDFRLIIGLHESLLVPNAVNNLKQIVGIERLEFRLLDSQEVHYILGKMTAEIEQELKENQTEKIPPLNSIGLFGQGLDIIPDSFGNAGENVTDAVTRLKTKFQSLLAVRLIKLTLNADSSQLNVTASMKLKNGNLLAQKFAVRGISNIEKAPEALFSGLVQNSKSNIPQVRVNSFVEFNLINNENQDLFATVLVIDPDGSINIIFPNNLATDVNNSIVKAGETRLIPDPNKGDQFSLRIGPPLGIVEVLVIASLSPLSEALKSLQGIATRGGQRGGTPVSLKDSDSTQAVDTLLQDLDRGTRDSSNNSDSLRSIYAKYNANSRAIDTRLLAAMSISFEIV